ncbi:S-adenosyl-L-methionine-dependent methyltransferase [Candidatus Mycoplasma haematolamae str. Purdue]|uniref:Ribosomal RNA small subunit methyltransferase H n=1 Tax=Mycoplasma haematolamae (strain Purdue) TaxID=1212765 RepID=I7C5K3_MYCHA|nr:16S rRNA (cytosine(1402)-N(4))-methyltransferase RsmH [Candidatus Mycoplasma haematolamae]AFO51787.1 S-adenosyl-L-methionine-dependent methyltransferase [Candidatus Mycoplasma haematolamae str. Purdue]
MIKHIPVLLKEVIENWITNPSGFYVDCTFGEGGHTKELLRHLDSDSKVLGIDIDPMTVETGRELEKQDSRFTYLNTNYTNLSSYISSNGLPKADGILFDLGFSTAQLGDPKRSFSYNNASSTLELKYGLEGTSVYEILNEYSEGKLSSIFRNYGQIREHRQLASLLVLSRKKEPIVNVQQLKELVEGSKIFSPRRNKNPLKLIFQALRIECNNELNNFSRALEKASKLLVSGGRLLVITFQSLEDELLLDWKKKVGQTLKIPDLGLVLSPLFSLRVGGVILPTRQEIELNWASRSAKLWAFTKEREE